MKRLILSVTAIAAAYGLQAATGSDFPTGTSFEENDAGTYTAAAPLWTVPTDANRQLTVTAGATGYAAACGRPDAWLNATDTKYLSVKTTAGKPIEMNVVKEGSASSQSIAEGAYFDGLIQFTPYDNAPADVSDAKIIVWARESDDGTATNLFVRAYNGGAATDFDCGTFANGDGWHRLTVRAIKDIYNAAEAVDFTPAFVVYVDGVPVTSAAAKLSDANLNDLATSFNTDGALFVSLDQTSANKNAISCAAFDGLGALDDLTLTANQPAFVRDATVLVNGKGYATLQDALTNVADNAQIKLLADATLTQGLTVGAAKNLTFDLNGKTLDYPTGTSSTYILTVGQNTSMVVSNGTITTEGRGVSVAGVLTLGDNLELSTACRSINCVGVDYNWSGDGATNNPAVVTIAAGATVTHGNGDGVAVFVRGSANSTRTFYQAKAILNVYGTIIDNDTSSGDAAYGLTSNGGNATIAEINFYDGSVYQCNNEDAGQMMWLPQVDLNLYGGTLTSKSQGIYFRCGKVNVPADSTVKIDVAGADAHALILDRCTTVYARFQYPELPTYVAKEIDVTIAGGEFSSGSAAILSEATDATKTPLAEFVSGGYFKDALDATLVEEGFRQIASATKQDYSEVVADVIDGSGTQNDPWVIASRANLKAFRNGVNNGTYAAVTNGAYVVQTADIDLRGETWTDIGTGLVSAKYPNNIPFNGNYDGQNHYVSNFVLSGANYCGFFNASQGGSIRNLRILDVHSPAGCSAVSILIGDVEPPVGKSFVIDNVTVSGEISGVHNVGGISAWLEGTIEIYNTTNLANCTSTKSKVGGLSPYYGGAAGTYLLFSNCCNQGTITLNKSIAEDATFAVGGILAHAQSAAPVMFIDCVNEGAICGTMADKDPATVKYFGIADLGGIMGHVVSALTVSFTNCVNTGSIIADVTNLSSNENAAVAGILGGVTVPNATIDIANAFVSTDAVLTTNVTAASAAYLGAFVGYNQAYVAATGKGVALTGKAPTVYAAVGRDLAVGGYASTSVEGAYTIYSAAAPSPIPPLPVNPTAQDVSNAVDQAGFVDPTVKELIGGDAAKYNDFKTWSATVAGGSQAVVASSHAAASYQLSGVVASPTLFANEPDLEITSLESLSGVDAGKWSIAITLKDGLTDVALIQAEIAKKVRVTQNLAQDPSQWAGAETTVEGDVIKVTPPAGEKAFMCILVTK